MQSGKAKVMYPGRMFGHDAAGAGELLPGTVLGNENGLLRVCLAQGQVLELKQAAACLITPEPGDSVLTFTPGAGQGYVLSVLEKKQPDSTLAFPGDVTLSARNLHLSAQEKLELEAQEGQARFVFFGLIAAGLDAKVQNLVSVCDTVRSTARSVVQHMRDCFRRVDNVDSVDAARLRQRVTKRYSLNAKDAALRAENDMKMDGERIHIG